MKRLQARGRYANVMSTLAVFIALGGSSYAALKLPANSVGTKQIKNNAVTSAKVKNGSLLSRDFKAGQLPQGPRGDQGPKGDRGLKGDTGDRGPSDAVAVYNNGPADMAQASGTTLATVPALPAGSYVINAKLWLDSTTGFTRLVTCVLTAAPDTDTVTTQLELAGPDNVNKAAVALQAVHADANPFTVTVSCSYDGTDSAYLHARDIKITAIRVANLSNTPVSG